MVERYQSPEHVSGGRLAIAALSDKGPACSVNEDSLAVHVTDHNQPCGGTLLVVADGLGGHNAGEVASRMVAEHVPAFFFRNTAENRLEAMQEAIQATNSMMHDAARTSSTLVGMGSTVVTGLITRQYLITANVGDSRAYVFRQGAKLLKTADDSTAYELPGIVQRRRGLSHALTQALGVQRHISPHIQILRIEPEDIILMCTDGITDVLSDNDISEIVRGQDITNCARELVAAATTNGSTDNMSVIIGRVLQIAPLERMHISMSALDSYVVPSIDPMV
ncbi:MAG: PP2C family protein-serine/threonine phosphatase [Bacteroidota bacterium]